MLLNITTVNTSKECVGFYLKESFEYKVWKDLFCIDSTIEHLRLEIKSKKKNSDFLVVVIYHPSSENKEKGKWIDKLDCILYKALSSCDGLVSLPSDTDKVVLREASISKLYITILENLGHRQVVTKPTRNGLRLINHTMANVDNVTVKVLLPCDEISDHDAPYEPR